MLRLLYSALVVFLVLSTSTADSDHEVNAVSFLPRLVEPDAPAFAPSESVLSEPDYYDYSPSGSSPEAIPIPFEILPMEGVSGPSPSDPPHIYQTRAELPGAPSPGGEGYDYYYDPMPGGTFWGGPGSAPGPCWDCEHPRERGLAPGPSEYEYEYVPVPAGPPVWFDGAAGPGGAVEYGTAPTPIDNRGGTTGKAAPPAPAIRHPLHKGHHPKGVGHHPKRVGHHGFGVGHHPRGAGHHGSGVGHHPEGVGHHKDVGHHPFGQGHHPPGAGHHGHGALPPSASATSKASRYGLGQSRMRGFQSRYLTKSLRI